MAAGKPVLATRVGGLPSIVRDGENGLLVNERNPVALAEAIVALATDARLRRTMGESGRALIVDTLNWDAVAARFVEVYEQARDRGGNHGDRGPLFAFGVQLVVASHHETRSMRPQHAYGLSILAPTSETIPATHRSCPAYAPWA